MQVFIVADQPQLRDPLLQAAHELGYDPAVITEPGQVLAALGGGEHPFFILTWCRAGLDGLAFCRLLRERDPKDHAFVLIVTDRPANEDAEKILEAGADDYFPANLTRGEMVLRLRLAARHQQRRAESAQVEKQLRTFLERFELSVGGANDGLWDAKTLGLAWNRPDTEVWYSPRFKELLGFQDEEFPNVLESWESRLHPDDRARVFSALADHIERHQLYDVEYRLRTKADGYHWFSARGQAMWDTQGQMLRMSGSLREITQIKAYEAQLEQSEAKWRSLVENAPDIIILTSPQGVLKFINRSTPEAEQAVGRTVYDYVREPDWERIRQAYEALLSTGQPQQFELRAHQQGGGNLWYSTRLGPVWHEGQIDSVVLIATDISHRKAAEAQTEQSEAKWRSLVENAPDLIILTDPDATIRFINRTTPGFEAAIGRTVYDYIDKEYWQVARAAHDAVCATGQPQQYEVRVHDPEGIAAWYAARLGPVWNNGRVEAVVRIATDITDRKAVEEQLRRERESLRHLLDLRERERQLVAYDIHDGLVQYLTGGIMHLEAAAVKTTRSARSRGEYDRGLSLLRDALTEARRLISGLRPPILDEQGIGAALEYLVNEARPDIPQLELVNQSYFGRLAAPLEVAMFRITQEALSNIRLHSGAKRARVELLQHGPWARLLIRDWGCGFDLTQVRRERFGLQGIRQRARLLGTAALVESIPGQGTLIAVDIPLEFPPSAGDTLLS